MSLSCDWKRTIQKSIWFFFKTIYMWPTYLHIKSDEKYFISYLTTCSENTKLYYQKKKTIKILKFETLTTAELCFRMTHGRVAVPPVWATTTVPLEVTNWLPGAPEPPPPTRRLLSSPPPLLLLPPVPLPLPIDLLWTTPVKQWDGDRSVSSKIYASLWCYLE